jgi:hypothetical protein
MSTNTSPHPQELNVLMWYLSSLVLRMGFTDCGELRLRGVQAPLNLLRPQGHNQHEQRADRPVHQHLAHADRATGAWVDASNAGDS